MKAIIDRNYIPLGAPLKVGDVVKILDIREDGLTKVKRLNGGEWYVYSKDLTVISNKGKE